MSLMAYQTRYGWIKLANFKTDQLSYGYKKEIKNMFNISWREICCYWEFY